MAQDNPNQSDYAILWWAISLEGIDQYFRFFAWRWSSREGNTDTTSFGSVLPFSNEIAGFFGHQNLWKEWILILAFLHGASHQVKVRSAATFC